MLKPLPGFGLSRETILIDARTVNYLVGAILTGAGAVAISAATNPLMFITGFPVFIYGLAVLIRTRKPPGDIP